MADYILSAKITGDASSFNKEFDGVQNKVKQTDSKMQGFGKGLTGVGNSITGVGKKAMKITAPIAAIGVASIVTGMDFQASMSKVQAISGATGGDMVQLEGLARDMGATTKFSASEAAEGLQYMAMAGWDTQQMMDGLPAILDLAAASGESLGVTADIVTDALTAFGLEASDATDFADLLASVSSNSNTNVAMLGETFKYVAPLAGALGYTTEDTALAIGLLANAGIKGGQAGTVLRTAINNLVSPTKAAQGVMDELGISMVDANGEMKPLDETLVDLRESFKTLTPAQQAQAAETLFGKQAMAGMLSIINATDEDFNNLRESTNEYTGAAKKMADTMEDNLQGSLTKVKSAMQEVGLKIYDIMLPALTKIVDKIADAVDWFSNLDEGTLKLIVSIGAAAVAIGPLLLAIGTVTKLVGIATTAFSGIGAAIAFIASPIGLAVAAIAAITIGLGIFAAKMSNEAIPEVERFGDGVSDVTKEALGDFMDMSDGVDTELTSLKFSGEEITQAMANSIKEKTKSMSDDVISSYEAQKTGAISALKSQFDETSSLTAEEQAKAISMIEDKYEQSVETTRAGQARIDEIMDEAYASGVELTSAQHEEINAITADMTAAKVEMVSQSELEQNAIMESLGGKNAELDARQAADIVANAVMKKDAVIAEANEEYEGAMIAASQLRAEGSEESNALADKIVADAERKRDEQVGKAEETHASVVASAQAQAGEHVAQVDWETGEIKSKWAMLTDSMSDSMSRIQEVTSSAFSAIGDALSTVGGIVGDFVGGALETLKGAFSGLAESHGPKLIGIFEGVGSIVSSLAGLVGPVLGVAFTILGDIFSVVVGVAQTVIGVFIDVAAKIMEVAAPIIDRLVPYIELLVEAFQKIWEKVQPGIEVFGEVVGGIFEAIGSVIEFLVDKIGGFVNTVLDGVDWVADKFGWFTGKSKETEKGVGESWDGINSKTDNMAKSTGDDFDTIVGNSSKTNKLTKDVTSDFDKLKTNSVTSTKGMNTGVTSNFNSMETSGKSATSKLSKDTSSKFSSIATDAGKETSSMQSSAVKNYDAMASGSIKSMGSMSTDTSTKFSEINTAAATKTAEMDRSTSENFSSLAKSAGTSLGGMSTDSATKFSSMDTEAKLSTGNIKKISTVNFGLVQTAASRSFSAANTAIGSAMSSAKNTVQSATSAISGFFSRMKLRIPKIQMPKLPKFSMTGKFSLTPPSVPKLGVSWNAAGGIFTKPTLLGGNQGVGEAGAEAVLPIEKLSGIMARMMNNLGYSNKEGNMQEYIPQDLSMMYAQQSAVSRALMGQNQGSGGGSQVINVEINDASIYDTRDINEISKELAEQISREVVFG